MSSPVNLSLPHVHLRTRQSGTIGARFWLCRSHLHASLAESRRVRACSRGRTPGASYGVRSQTNEPICRVPSRQRGGERGTQMPRRSGPWPGRIGRRAARSECPAPMPAPASPSANPVGSRESERSQMRFILPVVAAATALSIGIAPAAANATAPPSPQAGQVPRLPAPLRAHRAERQRHRRPRQGPPQRSPPGQGRLPRPRRRRRRHHHEGERHLRRALGPRRHRQLLGARLRRPRPPHARRPARAGA